MQTPPEAHLILPEGIDRDETERPGTPPVAAVTTAPPVATAVPAEFRVGLATFRRYPLRWLGYGLLALTGLTALVFAVIYQSLVLTLLGLTGLGFAAYKMVPWWLRTRNAALVVNPDQIVLESGMLTKQRTAVERENVTDVLVEQGWIPWMLGVGDIVIIATSGEEPTRLALLGVENPHDVAAHIRQEPPSA